MVIDRSPRAKIQRENEKKLLRSDDEKKEEMLNDLRKESVSIINLAHIYAQGYKVYGFDVTKALETAEEQTAVLERIYNEGYRAGYSEGIPQGKKYCREELIGLLKLYPGEYKEGVEYCIEMIQSYF